MNRLIHKKTESLPESWLYTRLVHVLISFILLLIVRGGLQHTIIDSNFVRELGVEFECSNPSLQGLIAEPAVLKYILEGQAPLFSLFRSGSAYEENPSARLSVDNFPVHHDRFQISLPECRSSKKFFPRLLNSL